MHDLAWCLLNLPLKHFGDPVFTKSEGDGTHALFARHSIPVAPLQPGSEEGSMHGIPHKALCFNKRVADTSFYLGLSAAVFALLGDHTQGR